MNKSLQNYLSNPLFETSLLKWLSLMNHEFNQMEKLEEIYS